MEIPAPWTSGRTALPIPLMMERDADRREQQERERREELERRRREEEAERRRQELEEQRKRSQDPTDWDNPKAPRRR